MALTTSQTGNLLFKKFFGKGSTNDSRQFFEEPFEGRPSVYLDQIWLQVDKIPTTAPVLSHNQILGVLQYKQDLILTAVPGTTNSFQSNQLKDAIPFYFGDGSYNYSVKSNTNAAIPFGTNDWVIDSDAGVLTFYNGVPANMPPKVSFYKYVGSKGAAILSSPGIPIVQSIDKTVTALPTGTSFTTDEGYSVVNGSWVVFTNLLSGANTIYQVSGVGSSLLWTEVFAFQGSSSPTSGNFLTITEGTSAGTLYRFTTSWANNLSDYVDSSDLTSALLPYLLSTTASSTYETIVNVTNALALKLNLTGGTMSGSIDLGSNKITSLANPTNPNDAVNLQTLQDVVGTGVSDLRIPLTASGSIPQGAPVFVVTTVDETVASASATSLGSSRLIGISEESVSDGVEGLITISGFATIPALQIDGGSFVRGQPVFLSENDGMLTSTPPTTTGSRVYQVGLAVSISKIVIDLKQGVTVA